MSVTAKQYLTKRCSELIFMLSENDINISDELEQALDEFGKLKWGEACEAQKKICAEQETPHKIIGGIEVWDVFAEEEKHLILSSPKAEYR